MTGKRKATGARAASTASGKKAGKAPAKAPAKGKHPRLRKLLKWAGITGLVLAVLAAGAFTGDVSAEMLKDAGAVAVIVGHSERRQYFGETDAALAKKLVALLDAGMLPILCCGESDAQREAGETEQVIQTQVDAAIAPLSADQLAKIVVAYEPIWAIGTGLVATPDQVQEAVGFVRALVGDRSRDAADAVRVLYGGSVKASNAPGIMDQTDVDGALVGGASIDGEEFVAICRYRDMARQSDS